MGLEKLRYILGPAPSEMTLEELCAFTRGELQRISSALMHLREVEKPKREKKAKAANVRDTMAKLRQLSEITGMSVEELVALGKEGL